jgi:hypothetical protein
MSIFDQRGQHVNYQYNSAGDINFLNVRNDIDFAQELQKLRQELMVATKAHILDNSASNNVDAKIRQAVEESEKETPNKKTIIDNLMDAKAVIEGLAAATGLVTALSQAIEVASRLFKSAKHLSISNNKMLMRNTMRDEIKSFKTSFLLDNF